MNWRIKKIKNIFRSRSRVNEIAPDEIFLDSTNLPDFDRYQFEGRLEKPIARKNLVLLAAAFAILVFIFVGKTWTLQVKEGKVFAERSENNRLDHTIVFSDRGVLYDRNNEPLAWNVINPENPDFSLRAYDSRPGLSGLLGYIKYPSKDTSGFYFREDFIGKEGLEKFYDDELRGVNGLKIIEINAFDTLQSESILRPPSAGKNITLSVDSRVQTKLYELMSDLAERVGFIGGSAIIMDINTGEIISLVNYPEYVSQVFTDGKNEEEIQRYLTNKNNPFLNRAIDGVFAPGSIMKLFIAFGALNEGVVDEHTSILSTGSISIPNPYFPGQSTTFKDWKAHGYVDLRRALAVSSDVYFYEVGGGYKTQKGIGISNIEKYIRMFGFGEPVDVPYFKGKPGVIPNPQWKMENFNEEWTLGNTYHTAIGQYGVQVTPIQVVRGVAAIAKNGAFIEPTMIKNENGKNITGDSVNLPQSQFEIVKEGMREAVLDGTAISLNVQYMKVAAKTGTAELGTSKSLVNSWLTGYFPYDDPHYAFAVVMERGPSKNVIGASSIMRQLFDWMWNEAPEYLK